MGDEEDILLLATMGAAAVGIYVVIQNMDGGYTPPKPTPQPTGCDPMTAYMWQIPGQQRLQLINSCLTLVGTVGRTSSAPDGDYNFDLKLDSAYSRYRSTAGSHGSNVWCEMICQKPVRDSSSAEAYLDKYRQACPGCNCYHGKKFSYLPATGHHVKVTGVYVKDVREGGHMEIHPVSFVTRI